MGCRPVAFSEACNTKRVAPHALFLDPWQVALHNWAAARRSALEGFFSDANRSGHQHPWLHS